MRKYFDSSDSLDSTPAVASPSLRREPEPAFFKWRLDAKRQPRMQAMGKPLRDFVMALVLSSAGERWPGLFLCSLRELAEAAEMQQSTVKKNLRQLRRMGFAEWSPEDEYLYLTFAYTEMVSGACGRGAAHKLLDCHARVRERLGSQPWRTGEFAKVPPTANFKVRALCDIEAELADYGITAPLRVRESRREGSEKTNPEKSTTPYDHGAPSMVCPDVGKGSINFAQNDLAEAEQPDAAAESPEPPPRQSATPPPTPPPPDPEPEPSPVPAAASAPPRRPPGAISVAEPEEPPTELTHRGEFEGVAFHRLAKTWGDRWRNAFGGEPPSKDGPPYVGDHEYAGHIWTLRQFQAIFFRHADWLHPQLSAHHIAHIQRLLEHPISEHMLGDIIAKSRGKPDYDYVKLVLSWIEWRRRNGKADCGKMPNYLANDGAIPDKDRLYEPVTVWQYAVAEWQNEPEVERSLTAGFIKQLNKLREKNLNVIIIDAELDRGPLPGEGPADDAHGAEPDGQADSAPC